MLMLILWLALIGVVAYLIETYLPMAQPFKVVVRVIIVICVIIFLLRAFGIGDMPLPNLGGK